MGVAYDLFGNGKTAVKFNLGKYMEAFTASNSDLDLNPLDSHRHISTTRSWTDTNKDFVPNCDLVEPREERRMRGHGRIRTSGRRCSPGRYDPDFITGWGNRPYNWELGVSVQQELIPRVSVNVGYFRNWWGNWYVVDNRATSLADYTPFSITAPVDARLPDGGGQTISGLYDLVPAKVGQVDELAQHVEQLRASRPRTGRAWMSTSSRGCGTGSRCRGARAPGAGSRTTAR